MAKSSNAETTAPSPEEILAKLPTRLREELLGAFRNIVNNYRQGRWEPSELNGGKLCEVVYSILGGYVDGTLPDRSTKPRNLLDACRAMENEDPSLPRSVRIQLPRMISALYEIRNNRGVGHAGGDVDPNQMDAIAVVSMAKWVVAELIRIFHDVDTELAQKTVESLVQRETPSIWEIGSNRRVLKANLTQKEKTMLLLYTANGAVSVSDLIQWIEVTNPSAYRRDVLRPAHRTRLIEFDSQSGTVEISPLGMKYVEDKLLTYL